MCHGYEMKWTKSEMTAKKIKETARQEEKIKRISEEKLADKELIPVE